MERIYDKKKISNYIAKSKYQTLDIAYYYVHRQYFWDGRQ